KCFMKKREFGWHVILYNIKRKIIISSKNSQTFIFYQIEIYSIRTKPFDNYISKFKKDKITKIFLTDISADVSDFDGFERLRNSADTLLIDHHVINPEMKNHKNIIKNHTPDCTTWVLYNFAKKFFDIEKWDWLACATMIAEFSFRDKDNAYFLKERYSDIEEKTIFDSEPGMLARKIDFNLKYYEGNLFVVYDLILKKELNELDRIYEIVNKEVNKGIEKYKNEAEKLNDKIYFAEFSPKFNISNVIVTVVCRKEPEKVFMIASDVGKGMVKISARNHNGNCDANFLIKKGIQGLENASGGGQIYAAGASFYKKDLEKFKENLLN
ncbi:DHH family phosphoesterase, partial [Candidatus Pacearchaeota archaeon]|nr:DHH family phosphoesterase [Candidatus Pacearchaeota archaeon]